MAWDIKLKTKTKVVKVPDSVSFDAELLHGLATPLTIIALNLSLLEEKLRQGSEVGEVDRGSKAVGRSFSSADVAEMRVSLRRSLEASKKLEKMMKEMRARTREKV